MGNNAPPSPKRGGFRWTRLPGASGIGREGQTLALIQVPAPVKGSANAAHFLSCLDSAPVGAHPPVP